ncbi:MAG: heme lyase CcmF/NrfE family subunit [Deltaproteobacteria bacterium]|nr:heme lyase CcmF/NrfE family subunit [Deltaproteobacteria bacterium]
MTRKAAHLVTLLVSLASIMLIFAFVTDNFEIKYVAEYSSLGLPLAYKLAGIWAGLDGSLLFWVWLLAICASIVAIKKEISPYINSTLQIIAAFFLIMLIFSANPFTELSHAPEDGQGLNPLLQNFFMIIHPPALYIGYVGFSVPFAYAISMLIRSPSPLVGEGRGEGESGQWIKDVRIWTIISWLFLTVGNLLGACWAYVELGWGGFWAWDPVENAGVMPWFTATAFLHSIIIQERRGMLKMWNIILVILTFLFTIFGTFITRSGIIQSVHSFSDVTIGMYFIVFLAIAFLFSLYLVISRRREISGRNRLESLISREGAFYINNLLLIFALVAITWGTCLPLFAEWFIGQKIEVGPPFFNRVMAPIGIALLFLTGIGPEMSWKKWRKGLFKKEFLWPAVLAVAAGIAAFAFGIRKWFPFLTAVGSVFLIATIIDEFLHTVPHRGFAALFRFAPRRYGGYAVHLGVVLLFIGIAGGAYKSEYNLSLKKGESVPAGNYNLTLNKINWVQGATSEGVIADVSIESKGAKLGNLSPALYLHKNQPKTIAEVDLFVKPLKDIYLALGGISDDENSAEVVLTINPLISFVWLGGLVMIIGTILAILPVKKRPDNREQIAEEEIDIELGRADKEDFV